LFLACLGALIACPQRVQADVLYATGFEEPTFVVGPLDGQDGWQDLFGSSAGTVTTSLPRSGSQAVMIDGGSLLDFGGFLLATYQRDFSVSVLGQIIRVQVDLRLDGPSTNTGDPIDDDLLSANLNVNNGDGFYLASWIISSGGNAIGFGSLNEAYLFSVPIALGEYNTYALDLDFINFRTDFLLNGVLVFSSPFDPAFDRTTLGNIQLEMFTVLNPHEAAEYQARFDNLSVMVVPEPDGLLSAGLGLIVLAGCARWRRVHLPCQV
jgi:hypothetical protein